MSARVPKVKRMGGLVVLVCLPFVCASVAAEESGSHERSLGARQEAMTVRELLYKALSLDMETEYQEAIPLLEQVIDRDPTQLDAWESLGWAYWYQGRRDRTRRLWERLLLVAPDDPRAHNMLAGLYLRQDELDASLKHYEQSLALDPHQDQIRFHLGQVYRWSGRLNQAIDLLDTLLTEDPTRKEVRLELARALSSNWAYARALPLWEEIREEDPDDLEYFVAEAMARLHVGEVSRALTMARQALERDPDDLLALQVLADAGEYGPDPAEGVPWLYRMLESSDDEAFRQLIRTRLSALLEQLNQTYPKRFPLDAAIALQAARVESDPRNVDGRLKWAELHLMKGDHRSALQGFRTVLDDFNPNNLRALRGMFESYLGLRRWDQAKAALEAVSAINPRDPYLHYDEAVFHANRGNYAEAYAALDRLEAAGRRGAVAVLLYHSLGTSPYGQAPSKEEFREQLLALRDAGYQFMTPMEMKDYFDELEREEAPPDDGPPPRLAVITFDDALTTAMMHGTPVGRELGVVIAQHIIVRNTYRGDAYLATWDELREYQDTGVWSFGSHSYYAHQEMPLTEEDMEHDAVTDYFDTGARVVPVDEVARRAYPLGNRIWRPEAGRLENRDEFIERLHEEYGRSRRDIEDELGVHANFFAYPFGEIGQQAASNEPEAVELNKQVARQYYDMGFLQSYYGHAVLGDDPMLYQRHEMHLRATGEETARYFLRRHPVYLAQRTRLQLALSEGNVALAEQVRADMRATQFPYIPADKALEAPAAHLRVSRIPRPWRVEWDGDPFDWDVFRPYGRLEYEHVEDNLESRYRRISAFAGANLAPNVLVKLQAASGHYRQEAVADGEAIGPQDPKVDEIFAGVTLAALLPNSVTLSGEWGARMWSGDADDTIPRISLQAQGFAGGHGEWLTRYEYDAIPAARAMVEGVTYHTVMGRFLWQPHERLDQWFDGRYHDVSDGNARYHLDIRPTWQVIRGGPFRLGARYAYASSDDASRIYWTPYQTHAFYGEASLRKGRPGLFISVDARVGLARESVRPEERRAFREREAEAAALGIDPGPGPEQQGWEPVFGVSASVSYELTRRWALVGWVSYFESVDYDQTDVRTSVEYRF